MDFDGLFAVGGVWWHLPCWPFAAPFIVSPKLYACAIVPSVALSLPLKVFSFRKVYVLVMFVVFMN